MGHLSKLFTGFKRPDSSSPATPARASASSPDAGGRPYAADPANIAATTSSDLATLTSQSSAAITQVASVEYLKTNTSAASLSSTASTGLPHRKGSARDSHREKDRDRGEVCTRFVVRSDGTHTHRLRNAHRQEKLTRMLREIIGGTGQKVGHDAVSAVPEFVQTPVRGTKDLSLMTGLVTRVVKGEVEVGNVNGSTVSNPNRKARPMSGSYSMDFKPPTQCLLEKYGKCQEVVGKGSYGTVRVAHKTGQDGHEQLYAVKEFRKRTTEAEGPFQDRLMSEYCISSQLRHPNIIHTLDLMKDTHGGFCQIMEYCPGGDLYSLIISTGGGLNAAEADCFFKQLMRGVVYMHSMGVAHCDLKPENILLTSNGTIKISDFGNGECFRMAWEQDVHYCKGVAGSGPYIAPEEFKNKPFDPRAVDIWATGIIYMVMRTGSYLWRTSVADEDDNYQRYLQDRKKNDGYGPIERLKPSKCVYVIYSILDPVPSRRITGKQVLNSEWGRSIRVCEAASCGTPPNPSSAAPSIASAACSSPVTPMATAGSTPQPLPAK